jgi:hypothetical protein
MQNYEKKSERTFAVMATPESTPDLCHGCQQKQAEAVAFVKRVAVATTTSHSGIERRREPRVSTDDAALMQVLNPLMDGRLAVRVLDVSRNGLKLKTETQLQRGTLVQIYIKNIVAMGEVRHCERIGDEYYAGVRLDDVLTHHLDEEPWNRALADQTNLGAC